MLPRTTGFLRRRGVLVFAAAALLAPLAFTGVDFDGPWPVPGLPRVWSGDEPHYLVILNSVLDDGDVDLADDYAAVHAGGLQAGRLWSRRRALDDHTRFAAVDERRKWVDCYSMWEWDWEGDVAVPVRQPGVTPPPPGTPEHSLHPCTQAFVLAVPLYPLRGGDLVEPAALACSALFTVGGLFFFRALLRAFGAGCATADWVAALTFLGTPVWFYARSLFLEGTLVCFVTGAYALALGGRSALAAGLLAGLAVQYKPHFALVALPLLADAAWRREWRRGLLLALPVAASGLLVLATYWWLEGSPLRPPQGFIVGDPVEGLAGLCFSRAAGLVWFAPLALPALLCWPAFLRRHGSRALAVAGGFALFALLMANFAEWRGGFCYGPRHLVPVLPLLFVSLVMLPEGRLWQNGVGRRVVIILAVAGVAANATAVFAYGRYFDGNPLAELIGLLRGVAGSRSLG